MNSKQVIIQLLDYELSLIFTNNDFTRLTAQELRMNASLVFEL